MGRHGPADYDADYIVVGSGAGGGTVAARLAEAGFRVLLLEAGGDPRTSIGSTPQTPGVNSLPDDYDVPGLPRARRPRTTGCGGTSSSATTPTTRGRSATRSTRGTVDGKTVDGVLYPRAGTLGGCTAHNAMILVYPHNADWNQIADLTGDASWRAEQMRAYFERIEHCAHRPDETRRAASSARTRAATAGPAGCRPRRPSRARRFAIAICGRRSSSRPARSCSSPEFAVTDADRRARLDSQLDPNDWRVVSDDAIGLRYTPLTTRNHRRVGTRERVLDVAKRHPDRLKIELHALATRVLFDEQNRAIGVEYLSGERLYGAHAAPERRTRQDRVRCSPRARSFSPAARSTRRSC